LLSAFLPVDACFFEEQQFSSVSIGDPASAGRRGRSDLLFSPWLVASLEARLVQSSVAKDLQSSGQRK
jgi:hypothetical protein